jgi:hypothetical protein
MRRIGMTHDPVDDFDDPDAEPGPLRRQVPYRQLADDGTASEQDMSDSERL